MQLIGENLSVAYNPETDVMNKIYLKQAYLHALKYSNDPTTQNGAVLVHSSGGVVIGGANGIPRRIENKPKRWKRPKKYSKCKIMPLGNFKKEINKLKTT